MGAGRAAGAGPAYRSLVPCCPVAGRSALGSFSGTQRRGPVIQGEDEDHKHVCVAGAVPSATPALRRRARRPRWGVRRSSSSCRPTTATWPPRTSSRARPRTCSGPRWPTATSPRPPGRHRQGRGVQPRASRSRAGPAGTPSSRSSPTTCRSSSTRSPPSSSAWSRTVHLVVHPQMRVRRDADRRARGDPARRRRRTRAARRSGAAVEFGVARVVDAPRDRPRQRPGRPRGESQRAAPRARQRPRGRRGLAQDAGDLRRRSRRPRQTPARRHPGRGGRAGPGAARVAGRQPLHLPRLPRVRPDRGAEGDLLAGRAGHRARAAALRPPRATGCC